MFAEGLAEFDRKIKAFARTPEAIERAVTYAAIDTATQMKATLDNHVERKFDRPTPYIAKRGLKVKYPRGKMGNGADKAGVYYEFFGRSGMSPESVMKPHVFGGPRRKKASERRLGELVGDSSIWAIMGDSAPRNQYGNIPGARYSQMLSGFGLIETARSSRGSGERNRSKAATSSNYFLKRKPGYYLIMERRGKSAPKPMLLLTRRTPNYKKRYDFFGVGRTRGQQAFNYHFPRKLLRELKQL